VLAGIHRPSFLVAQQLIVLPDPEKPATNYLFAAKQQFAPVEKSQSIVKAAPGVIYGESLARALGTRFLVLGTDLSFSQSSSPSVLPPRKLTRVKELIEANLEGDLSLKILARESGYSRAHFATP
jgi:transcriptional regulator GlxA family with amidase domain